MAQKKKINQNNHNDLGASKSTSWIAKNTQFKIRKEFGSATAITATRRSLRKQQGFGAILLLALLPLILALLIGILLLLSTQQALLGAKQICRKELISMEKKSGEQLQALEALNLQIKALRIEELKLKAELAIAIATENWPAVAMVKASLTVVNEQFQNISFQQKILLQQNKGTTEYVRTRLPIQMSHTAKVLAEKIKGFVILNFELVSVTISPLAVRPDKPSSSAPVYELEEPFIQRQSSQVFWRIKIYIPPTSWAAKWFRSQVTWKESCGGSLQKEKIQWQSILIETKKDRF